MDHPQMSKDMSTFGSCRQCKDGCRKLSRHSNSAGNTVIEWPRPQMSEVASPAINDIQIALADQTYAEQLRGLLEADGKHRAHIVAEPNPIFDGVIVLDETTVDHFAVPAGREAMRIFVLAGESSDSNKLWRAGVRRVLPAKQPLELIRFAILYTQLILGQENSPGDLPEAELQG